jgi:hypothetical protein
MKNKKALSVLRKLIVRVTIKHPRQAMWRIVRIAKSTDQTQSQRALQMIRQAVKVAGQGGLVEKLARQTLELAEELVRLANASTDKDVKPPSPLSLPKDFERLSRMRDLEVMVPLERLMVPRLPQGRRRWEVGITPSRMQW